MLKRNTQRKPPRDQSAVLSTPTDDEMQRDEDVSEDEESQDASTQTEMNLAEQLEMLRSKLLNLEKKLEKVEKQQRLTELSLSFLPSFLAVYQTSL